MPIDQRWLWFQRYGFSREEYDFATARRPDGRDPVPESQAERVARILPRDPVPGMSPPQRHQASDRFVINAAGVEFPEAFKTVPSIFDKDGDGK
jgi:hypothetical protein